MHISGAFSVQEVDIHSEKVDIETLLAENPLTFSRKTTGYLHVLFETFGFHTIFGKRNIMELLGLKESGASKLLSHLVQAGLLESVSGFGKGKDKFKQEA